MQGSHMMEALYAGAVYGRGRIWHGSHMAGAYMYVLQWRFYGGANGTLPPPNNFWPPICLAVCPLPSFLIGVNKASLVTEIHRQQVIPRRFSIIKLNFLSNTQWIKHRQHRQLKQC